jgi:hypothetical protein
MKKYLRRYLLSISIFCFTSKNIYAAFPYHQQAKETHMQERMKKLRMPMEHSEIGTYSVLTEIASAAAYVFTFIGLLNAANTSYLIIGGVFWLVAVVFATLAVINQEDRAVRRLLELVIPLAIILALALIF